MCWVDERLHRKKVGEPIRPHKLWIQEHHLFKQDTGRNLSQFCLQLAKTYHGNRRQPLVQYLMETAWPNSLAKTPDVLLALVCSLGSKQLPEGQHDLSQFRTLRNALAHGQHRLSNSFS